MRTIAKASNKNLTASESAIIMTLRVLMRLERKIKILIILNGDTSKVMNDTKYYSVANKIRVKSNRFQ